MTFTPAEVNELKVKLGIHRPGSVLDKQTAPYMALNENLRPDFVELNNTVYRSCAGGGVQTTITFATSIKDGIS